MDRLTPEQRHKNMAAIKGFDTTPELVVRSFLWREGFRFRVNDKRLPGKPDIVLPLYHTAIFVHGCFWHAHDDCEFFRMPKSNVKFWTNKLQRNKSRDELVRKRLKLMGWNTMVVWECQLRGICQRATLNSISTLLHLNLLRVRGAVDKTYAIEEVPYSQAAESDENLYGRRNKE